MKGEETTCLYCQGPHHQAGGKTSYILAETPSPLLAMKGASSSSWQGPREPLLALAPGPLQSPQSTESWKRVR